MTDRSSEGSFLLQLIDCDINSEDLEGKVVDKGIKGGGEIESNDGQRGNPEVEVMDSVARIKVIMA